MKILVTNDDGINSYGLKILVDVARQFGEVFCIAPMTEQSGKSHSIIIKDPIQISQEKDIVEGVRTYSVNGTPGDCVRIAYYYLKEEFDIVFSGVNNGYNLGEDILYSGTVGAASEGVLCGKKAIAFSTERNHFENIVDELNLVLNIVKEKKLLDINKLWNINICNNYKGIKFTSQGYTNFDSYYEMISKNSIISRGSPDYARDKDIETSDVKAIYNNYISITPLTIDRTDYNILNKIK